MRKSHGKVRDGRCFMVGMSTFRIYEHADFLKFSLNGQAVPSGGVSRAQGEASVESASKRSSAGSVQEKRRQNARGFVRYCENHRRERRSGKGGHAEMMK